MLRQYIYLYQEKDKMDFIMIVIIQVQREASLLVALTLHDVLQSNIQNFGTIKI